MHQRVVGREQKASEDLLVAAVDETAVLAEHRVAVLGIDARYPIPGHARPAMMHDVKVVVEKDESQNRAVLHNGRPLLDMVARLVLGKRAHERERRAEVGKAEEVLPERHPADDEHPGEQQRNPERVPGPDAAMSQVAPADFPNLLHPEPTRRPNGPKHQPAEQGGLNAHEKAPRRAELLPAVRGPIPAFRVVERIGQSLVAVVGEVGFPIAFER